MYVYICLCIFISMICTYRYTVLPFSLSFYLAHNTYSMGIEFLLCLMCDVVGELEPIYRARSLIPSTNITISSHEHSSNRTRTREVDWTYLDVRNITERWRPNQGYGTETTPPSHHLIGMWPVQLGPESDENISGGGYIHRTDHGSDFRWHLN